MTSLHAKAEQLFRKVCDLGMDGANEEESISAIAAALQQVQAEEREACINIAVDFIGSTTPHPCTAIATAIRALKEQP